MTQLELNVALNTLSATELVTGMDLSTVRWAVQRQHDVEHQAIEDAHTWRAERCLVLGTNYHKEVAS
jgi:hypothetical protein